ncbi:hypothetical protein [Bradyrhizobium ottawaense]|uniref:hypothetical protein n=1 Tax=Bradyrhizobium ottawaense TaxID=931866 RepID=UPI003834ACE7
MTELNQWYVLFTDHDDKAGEPTEEAFKKHGQPYHNFAEAIDRTAEAPAGMHAWIYGEGGGDHALVTPTLIKPIRTLRYRP